MPFALILRGHVLRALRRLEDESIDCVVTSPPYYMIRNYEGADPVWWEPYHPGAGRMSPTGACDHVLGSKDDLGFGFCSRCGAWFGQLGLEPTVDLYLDHLLMVTAELKRVLKKSGVVWWNIGDKYSGSGFVSGKEGWGAPEKSLLMIPYRLAWRAVEEQGWILRDVVIWEKMSAMPSSVKDRFTPAYEPVLMFTKSPRYYFDVESLRGRLELEPGSTEAGMKRSAKNGKVATLGGKPAPISRVAADGAAGGDGESPALLTQGDGGNHTLLDWVSPGGRPPVDGGDGAPGFPRGLDGGEGGGGGGGLDVAGLGVDVYDRFAEAASSELAEGEGAPAMDGIRSLNKRTKYLRNVDPTPAPGAKTIRMAKRYAAAYGINWERFVKAQFEKYRRMSSLITGRMKEKGYDLESLAEATGIPARTIRMYLHSPSFSSFVPREKEWLKLDSVLGLGDYTSVVPQFLFIRGGASKPRNVIHVSWNSMEGAGIAHFAVFPEALVEPLVVAGSPPGGVVLDPFAGSGTVGVAAKRLGRSSVLIELSGEYVKIIKRRIGSSAGNFRLIEKDAG